MSLNPNRPGVAGLKLSNELCLLQQHVAPEHPDAELLIYRRLAERRINVRFCLVFRDEAGTRIVCCPDAGNDSEIAHITAELADSQSPVIRTTAVGLISVFPHHGQGDILASALAGFNRAGINVYAAAGSLSAYTLVIDFNYQEQAVAVLREVYALPAQHSLIRPLNYDDPAVDPAWRTIARYQEPVIKTYGLNTRSEIGFTKQTLERSMTGIAGLEIGFSAMGRTASGDMQLWLAHTNKDTAHGEGDRFFADLVFFNGPHFGDRYAIADRALGRLMAKHIPIYAMACAEATCSILLPPQSAASAVRELKKVFVTP